MGQQSVFENIHNAGWVSRSVLLLLGADRFSLANCMSTDEPNMDAFQEIARHENFCGRSRILNARICTYFPPPLNLV
jgi:hypothetical protein